MSIRVSTDPSESNIDCKYTRFLHLGLVDGVDGAKSKAKEKLSAPLCCCQHQAGALNMASLVQPHPADNETIATVMQRHGDTAHTHSLGQQEASPWVCAVFLSPLLICHNGYRKCLVKSNNNALVWSERHAGQTPESAGGTGGKPPQLGLDLEKRTRLTCRFAANGSKRHGLFMFVHAPYVSVRFPQESLPPSLPPTHPLMLPADF